MSVGLAAVAIAQRAPTEATALVESIRKSLSDMEAAESGQVGARGDGAAYRASWLRSLVDEVATGLELGARRSK